MPTIEASPSQPRAVEHVKVNKPQSARDLAFVYENGNDKNGADSMDPNSLNIVTTLPEFVKQTHDDIASTNIHAAKHSTRKEVALLRNTMIKLLGDVGAGEDQDYPTEMHVFLDVVQNEQKIYDTVFLELIRQVAMNMIERGELLSELRRRYANMFIKIPRHVRHLHTELIAQRQLNRRLSEELVRLRETVSDLVKELEFVRQHDIEVTKQASDAQEKLVSVLTQSDNTDEVLEEYHKLYKMQRERLEQSIRTSEQEKRLWIDAATQLALRVGDQIGATDIVTLQKDEQIRLRFTTHVIVKISEVNDLELNAIERLIDEWRTRLVSISQTICDDDRRNIEKLSVMQREIKVMIKNITANVAIDEAIEEHPLLNSFFLYDLKSVISCLGSWADAMSGIVAQFTSERDITLMEEINYVKKQTNVWIEASNRLLSRIEKTTNGKDYEQMRKYLNNVLASEIDEWINKLELRVSNNDGNASYAITLQNQIDDRCTEYSTKDPDKPLSNKDRMKLKELLESWTDIIGNLISKLL